MSNFVRKIFDLSGKVAVITGGAGMLGIKHAEAIAEFGGIPVLIDIRGAKAEEKAKDIGMRYGVDTLGLQGDITRKQEVEESLRTIVKKFGHVDILINNAARDPKVKDDLLEKSWSRFENFPLDRLNEDMAVGLTGASICSQVFGSYMAKKGKGVILNIVSDLGVIAPDQRLYRQEGVPENRQPVKPVTYSIVKHGLSGLTKYLASYWGDKGVRVNALSPGGVYNNQPEEFVKRVSELIPLGRMADKDEYKAAVVFLVSDASSYMTGANVIIDGGRTII